MILSSIGSILTSLLPPDASVLRLPNSVSPASAADLDAQALRSRLILNLSLSSTIARLITGGLADYLAPLVPSASAGASRRITLRRSTLAAACVGVLLAVFAYGAAGLRTPASLWVVSAGTGAMYGAVFTLLPAVTSQHYGPAHFGLAWGMLSVSADEGGGDRSSVGRAHADAQCHGAMRRRCCQSQYFSALGSVVFSVSLRRGARRVTALELISARTTPRSTSLRSSSRSWRSGRQGTAPRRCATVPSAFGGRLSCRPWLPASRWSDYCCSVLGGGCNSN